MKASCQHDTKWGYKPHAIFGLEWQYVAPVLEASDRPLGVAHSRPVTYPPASGIPSKKSTTPVSSEYSALTTRRPSFSTIFSKPSDPCRRWLAETRTLARTACCAKADDKNTAVHSGYAPETFFHMTDKGQPGMITIGIRQKPSRNLSHADRLGARCGERLMVKSCCFIRRQSATTALALPGSRSLAIVVSRCAMRTKRSFMAMTRRGGCA